jgi:hypothetical protein
MSTYYQDAFCELEEIVGRAIRSGAVDRLINELRSHAEALDLADKHGHWGEHPPLESGRSISAEGWACEVGGAETRLGYWDWVASRLEQDREES